MSIPASPAPPRRRRRLKRIAIVVGAIPFLVVLIFGIEWKWTRMAGQRKLDVITARLDADDPGWRFEEIVAAHNAKVPPDAENSAVRMVNTVNSFPGDPLIFKLNLMMSSCTDLNYRPSQQDWNSFCDVDPAWKNTLDDVNTCLKANQRGRIPIEFNGGDPSLIRVQGTSCLAKLVLPLLWSGKRSSLEDDTTIAVQHTGIGLQLVQLIDFEPTSEAYLSRAAIVENALALMEQLLAWKSDLQDSDLERLQLFIARELEYDPLIQIVRTERAMKDRKIETLDRQNSGWSRLSKGEIDQHLSAKETPGYRADVLNYFNDLLSVLHAPQRGSYVDFMRKSIPRVVDSSLQRQGTTAFTAHIRKRAFCLCAMAGIACERYRIKHQKWPDTLDLLDAFGFKRGLVDPCLGEPLEIELDDRQYITISCTSLHYPHSKQSEKVIFRLWNVTARNVPDPLFLTPTK